MAALRSAYGLATCFVSFAWLVLVLNPIQMLSVLVRPFSKPAFRAVNRWCARSIWGWWAWMAEHQNGVDLRFSGDPLPGGENAVILPNHQTMADVMVLLCYGRRTGRVGDLKWFVKDPIKWVPGPGWGMKFLDCIYVKRNWAKDEASIRRLFGKFSEERIPISLVSFLEGTRRTPEKLARAQAFARDRGLPVPRHTLVPRTKGFVATIEGLRDHLDAVHDLTIVYPDGVPGLLDCFAMRVPRIDVYFRRYAIDELPRDRDRLEAWVRARFEEKDALVDGWSEEQGFPAAGDGRASPGRVARSPSGPPGTS